MAVNGWLTSHLQTPYPFLVTPGTWDKINELIVDLNISDRINQEMPVKITSFDPDYPAYGSPSILIKFSNNTVLFDSASASSETEEFGDWAAITWFANDNTATVTIIINRERILDFTYPLNFTDGEVIPDKRVQRIQKVDRFRTLATLPDPGNIILKAGYNVKLEKSPSREGDPIPIRVSVIPGAGEGKYPDCTHEDFIRTINDVRGNNNGAFYLTGDGCYRMEQPATPAVGPSPSPYIDQLVEFDSNTLKLLNFCEACCTCEEYAATYNEIKKIWENARVASAAIIATRGEYEDTLAEWEAARVLRQIGLKTGVRLSGHPGFFIAVSVMISNNSCADIAVPTVAGTIAGMTTGKLMPDSGFLQLAGGVRQAQVVTVTGAGFTAAVGATLKPTAWMQLSFFLYFQKPAPPPDTRDGIAITITVNGQAEVVTLVKTTDLDNI